MNTHLGNAWMLKKDGTEIQMESHPPASVKNEISKFMIQHDDEAGRLITDELVSAGVAEMETIFEMLYHDNWCKIQVGGEFNNEVIFQMSTANAQWHKAIVDFLKRHEELHHCSVTIQEDDALLWDGLSIDYIFDSANTTALAEMIGTQGKVSGGGKLFITGDIHGSHDIHKLATAAFPEQKQLCKDDFLIICGDFGLIWEGEDKYWLNWLEKKRFSTLFVDGNHENHKLLSEYSISEFAGGKVHKIRDSVYHLMRGEVFTISGKKIFAMGGAASHDKEYRKEDISWWPEEMPSEAEYKNALENLSANEWRVDYIISHCAACSVQDKISAFYEHNKLTCFLEDIKKQCRFEKWFFGHYHTNSCIDEKYFCTFEYICQIL